MLVCIRIKTISQSRHSTITYLCYFEKQRSTFALTVQSIGLETGLLLKVLVEARSLADQSKCSLFLSACHWWSLGENKTLQKNVRNLIICTTVTFLNESKGKEMFTYVRSCDAITGSRSSFVWQGLFCHCLLQLIGQTVQHFALHCSRLD